MDITQAAEVEICEEVWRRIIRRAEEQVENLNYYTVRKQVGSRVADQTRDDYTGYTILWLPVFDFSRPSIERLVRDQAVEEAP
jgi:hypothetical protein